MTETKTTARPMRDELQELKARVADLERYAVAADEARGRSYHWTKLRDTLLQKLRGRTEDL